MKRASFFSPLSLGIAAAVLLSTGLLIWRTGGMGFNPGLVTAKAQAGISFDGYSSHTMFAARCDLCHQPLTANQNDLCTRCHTKVAAEISSQTGLHGRLPGTTRCAACHPEHQGQNFDPTSYALAHFDHTTTSFPLTGRHAAASCTDCHAGNHFQPSPRMCVDCHQEPAIHAGMFGTDCSACHSTASWKPANVNHQVFDHNQVNFSLVRHTTSFDGKAMTCTACHVPGKTAFDQSTCINCHSQKNVEFVSQHRSQYGDDCLQCHDGSDRMHGFVHDRFFPLDGKHASIACADCHASQHFKGTPNACSSCHQEPEIHAGYFGLQCSYCHNTTAWSPTMLYVHPFPVNHGGQSDVPCQTCHPNQYTSYTCYTCHDHQATEIANSHAKAGISTADLPDCMKCHPAGTVEKKAAPGG